MHLKRSAYPPVSPDSELKDVEGGAIQYMPLARSPRSVVRSYVKSGNKVEGNETLYFILLH